VKVPARLEPSSAVVLVGAGASVDAGLPTAWQLYDRLVDSLVHRRWASTELKRLARLPRPDARDRHDAIRFEMLLEWVSNVFDEHLSFFSFLDAYRVPGRLHLGLAQAAAAGAVLLTVNYDDLLERAINESGRDAYTVDAHRCRRAVPVGCVPVYKLHGTRVLHRPGKARSSNKELQATLETISTASPGGLLGRQAFGLLRELVDGKSLLCVGYSGSDDLDIVPALLECSPHHVYWINHSAGAVVRHTPRRPDSDSAPWVSVVWNLRATGCEVDVLEGPTLHCLESIGIACGCHRARKSAQGEWQRSVRNWARVVGPQDPTGLGLATQLFSELGRREVADRALRESRPSALPRGGWTPQRRRYERAQLALLGDCDVLNAHRLGLAARSAAIRAGDKEMEIKCELLLGRALFLQQDLDGALLHFSAALRLSPDDDRNRAWSLGWMGRALAWGDQYLAARAPLKAAVRLFTKLGDLEGLLDAEHALGLVRSSLGRIDLAQKHYGRAEEIAKLLGFLDRHFTAGVAGAECLFIGGSIDEARIKILRALRLVECVGDDEIAIAWQIFADIAMEQAHYRTAAKACREALQTTTVVTRDYVGNHWASLAEAQLMAGWHRSAARSLAEAKNQPRESQSWWGITRAAAVDLCLNPSDTTRSALIESVRRMPALDAGALLVAASSLQRIVPPSVETRTVVGAARRLARRAGSSYWQARLA
jgi:tetratricopeptide (TPR) repeat protein